MKIEKQREQKELDLLLGKGFEIRTVFLGKVIVWETKKMTLGRLLQLSNVYHQIKVDEEKLYQDSNKGIISEQYKLVKLNVKHVSKALAIAVSDIKWLRPFIARHFLKNISTTELKDYTEKLIKQGNYENFIISIILLSANRLTKAEMIEKTA